MSDLFQLARLYPLQVWPLPNGRPQVIGRPHPDLGPPDIDLSPDILVSRRHATITVSDQHYSLADLGSRHGTTVQGQPLLKGQIAKRSGRTAMRLGQSIVQIAPCHHIFVEHGNVAIEIGMAPEYGLAQYRSGGRIISQIAVTNTGKQLSGPASLSIEVEDVLHSVVEIPETLPENTTVIGCRLLEVNEQSLAKQVERSSKRITASVDGLRLPDNHRSIEILAFNEWSFRREARTSLASFTVPNDARIADICVATQTLRYQGRGSPAADLAAIYQVLSERYHLAYVPDPPYSSSGGQKIRLPESALDIESARGAGTCLDLALIVAAALEHLGHQPLVCVIRDQTTRHAIVGVWKNRGPRIEPLITNKHRLLNEALFIDPTGTTTNPDKQMTTAESRALVDRVMMSHRFEFAVDITAARNDGVQPVAAR